MSDSLRARREAHLRPTELNRCAFAVAVDAANVALRYLRLDATPRVSSHQSRYGGNLLRAIAVVKFEHDGVSLAAIDAGKGCDELRFPGTIAATVALLVRAVALKVSRLVSPVMLPAIRSYARTTNPRPSSRLLVLDAELEYRLCLTARVAGPLLKVAQLELD